MRTRTQIEPNRLLSRESQSQARRGTGIFPDIDFTILPRRGGQQRRYCLATVPA